MKDEAAIEAEIQAKGLNAPRLTPQHIDDQIVGEYFVRASEAFKGASASFEGVPIMDELKCLTICVMVLKNGFMVTGESACASPANFNAEIGRKIARDNARNKIWALEGYMLKSQLAEAKA